MTARLLISAHVFRAGLQGSKKKSNSFQRIYQPKFCLKEEPHSLSVKKQKVSMVVYFHCLCIHIVNLQPAGNPFD